MILGTLFELSIRVHAVLHFVYRFSAYQRSFTSLGRTRDSSLATAQQRRRRRRRRRRRKRRKRRRRR